MSPSGAPKRLLSLGALAAALACGGDSAGPTEPPTPGAPPTITATAFPTTADVPFQLRVRVALGGDSLARLLVQLEGRQDTISPITLANFDYYDSVVVVGAHSARLILQSAAGRADTAEVTLTGTNPLPVLGTRTLSLDSTETTDSVLLTLQASDNRGGVSLVSVWGGVSDSVYSAGSTVTRARWLRRPTAGVQRVSVRVRDADGGSVADSAPVRFFVLGPSAELKVPVRADTAPLVVQASVILHRATMAYDSVRVMLSNGITRLFTGLARADTVQIQDTLSEVGVTQVTARWYHPSANGEMRDSVEVLLAPNQPPSASFAATADTVNEGDSASYTLSFSDDRGVREARFYRVTDVGRTYLRTVELGDALTGNRQVEVLLTPGATDSVEAIVEDRDGLADTARAAPVYTDLKPVITGSVLNPGSVLFGPSVQLTLQTSAVDESPASLECSATTTQGKGATGGLVLQFGMDNPSVAQDSLRVSAAVECRDARGQLSTQLVSNAVTILHADSMTFRVYRADSLLPAQVVLSIAGTPSVAVAGSLQHWFRGGATVSLGMEGEAWFVVRANGAQVSTPRRTPNTVLIPLVGGGEAKVGFIPDNPEYRTLLEQLSLLSANDTVSIRSLFPNANRDADPGTLGHQINYVPLDPLSDVVPDSTTQADFASAVEKVQSELRTFAVEGRFIELVRSGLPGDSLYIRWNGPNTWGFGYSNASPSPMTSNSLNARRVQHPPGGNIIQGEVCWREAHVLNALLARGYYLFEKEVRPIGIEGLYTLLANEADCHLTDLTKRLSGIRSWFGSYTFYTK